MVLNPNDLKIIKERIHERAQEAARSTNYGENCRNNVGKPLCQYIRDVLEVQECLVSADNSTVNRNKMIYIFEVLYENNSDFSCTR